VACQVFFLIFSHLIKNINKINNLNAKINQKNGARINFSACIRQVLHAAKRHVGGGGFESVIKWGCSSSYVRSRAFWFDPYPTLRKMGLEHDLELAAQIVLTSICYCNTVLTIRK
jgi:hypothetical protein